MKAKTPGHTATRRTGGRAGVRRVRKNMDMDPAKLRAVKALLGAKTETETVDWALDLVIGKERSLAALRRLADRGGLKDIYAREP